MFKIKYGDKELKIRYGYEPTLKARIMSKVAKIEAALKGDDSERLETLEDLLLFMPEYLLVGLQAEEPDYRYDWDTNEGKEEKMKVMYEIMDAYCSNDDDDSDAINLYFKLNEEMLNNGFLKSMYRKELKQAETEQKATKKTATKKN